MAEKDSEHYFTAQPTGDLITKKIQVRLAHSDYTVETAGGIFSPDHVDAGTEALLFSVPQPPNKGNLLDIGCGWGPLALTMALEAPNANVYAVDVNERSVELTRRNARNLGLTNVSVGLPEEIGADVRFDQIWSNPPIRVGKAQLHEILSQWLPRLNPGGSAYLVVAKHLGADSLEKWLSQTFGSTHETTRADTRKGFRIIKVQRKEI